MRKGMSVALLALAMVGCSSTASPSGPAHSPTSPSRAGTQTPTVPGATAIPRVPVAVDPGFRQIVRTLCRAFAHRDASTVVGALPYYQYNSGLRYGTLGDGEGQTGDPSLMASWLANSHVQCKMESSGSHGHGTVLATGWPQRGSALIELDTYSGRWKINDFTFGPYGALALAMRTAGALARYAG